jgi:hypothetical protein
MSLISDHRALEFRTLGPSAAHCRYSNSDSKVKSPILWHVMNNRLRSRDGVGRGRLRNEHYRSPLAAT